MATTQNTYTGNGSTTAYSFTFPYLNTADVKVSLDTVDTTAYTLSNATTVAFTTAPASGAAIRIYRDTNVDSLNATFYPGSAIRSSDLNNNFTQNLYVTQEADFDVDTANTTANTAKTTADTALTNSAAAVTTANAASTTATAADTNASAAVVTANAASATATTASTAAANAVTTANTASTTATTALTNSRESDGSGGFNTAISVANSATTTANTALSNSRESDGSGGFNTAISKANTADTNATAAVNTANAASAAVSNAVLFTLIANVAAIPGSPSNNDYIEIGNSTGVESFSPLSGVPSGFVGASGLTVRLRYDSSASSWVFMNYFANDSETRYLTKNIPVVTGDSTNGSGQITLNCEVNTHGVKIKGPPHSAAADYTLTLPNDDGTSSQVLSTDGSGVLSWADQPDISGKADTSTVNTALAAKADLAGPTFTGVPAAPTAGSGTNNTQIATTAFVTAAVPDISGKANLASPTFTGTVTIPAGASIADIGTTIQAFDADTAKTDTAQTFTAAQRGTIGTLTDGATITPDFATANNFTVTLAGNRTIANPTNLTAGQSGSIFIVQDGTGSRTAAWGSYWDFAGGTAPTLTTTAAAVDRVDYVVRSSTSIHTVFTGNYS